MGPPPPPPPGLPFWVRPMKCGTCTVCKPITPLTPCSEAGMTASLALANASRPSWVWTRSMLVWNADCTAAAGAVAETSSRFGEMVTWEKPCCVNQAATAFASASLGPYWAVNWAGVRLGWFGLAMKACSCASLRNCNETETRIGAARDIGPVTVSPACNAAACATTLVPAGAAAQANEPTASPKPTTKLFNRNMFDIEISSKCTKWDRACRHSRATPEQSGYRPISLD